MLSHELRNPLSAISSSIHVLRTQGADNPLLDHASEVARRQVEHVAHLLDDLLDTARITRSKIELRRQPLDLRRVLRDAVELATPRSAGRRQEIIVSLSPEPIPVEGDPDRLQQVVGNLLNNATKYTPEGGHISVSAGTEEGKAVVRVSDDGIGIPPELIPHVFDLFVQAKRSPDRSQGGLGLGLTLVHHLTELHGGSVEAHSAGDGKGSEFVVRLPLSSKLVDDADGAGSNASSEAQYGSNAAENIQPARLNPVKRILLVDDNADTADLLALALGMDGHEVMIVHDGPEALRVSAEWHPEVVLLDIGLPGMDGYEVARRLRQKPGLSGVALVAVTGYGQEEDRQRAREAGFDRHLVKPADLDAIKRMLQEILSAPGQSSGAGT
jgi:CheY-like chemotaxis protein